VFRDQTIHTHTVGTYAGTPLVAGANQTGTGGNNGTMTLVMDGFTSGSTTLKKGDRIFIGSSTSATDGGVEGVYPQTRESQGYQQCFTIQEDVSDVTGTVTATVYPAATISGQYQNVNIAPPDNGIVTIVGASGVRSTQGLIMHEQSFAFVSIPLAGPAPGEGATVAYEDDPETGISLRMIKAFDYNQSRHINRVDVLYDFASLYRELACVVQS
jgi:hypothetical protein